MSFDLRNKFDPNIPLTGWAALAKGQTLGKRAIVNISSAAQLSVMGGINSSVNLLNIQSDNQYSSQLCLTLSPPKFITNAADVAALQNVQDATGEFTNQINNFPGIVIANATVLVDWGIGGVSETVQADFSNGLCLNFCASFLRVTALIDNKNIIDVVACAYVLSAFIGPGTPKANNAQRSIVVLFEENISPMFAVPLYAKAVTVMGLQTVAGVLGSGNPFNGTIQFFRSDVASVITIIGEATFDEVTHHPVVVPNGAFFFRVISNNPALGSASKATAVFDLAI